MYSPFQILGPWLGGDPPFDIVSAYVVATNCVRVITSLEMQQTFETRPFDALNPATWSVVSDTGKVFTVLKIDVVSTTVVDVFVLGSLANFITTYTVSAPLLRDVDGNTVAVDSANFTGIYVESDLTIDREQPKDFRNYATPRNPLGGTLNIGTDGDYQEIGGDEFIKNMIIRRLITRRGAFFHAPTYGFGLTVKGLVTPASMLQLKIAIERECLKEPEVQAASVRCSYQSSVLSVDIFVTSRTTGSTVAIPTLEVQQA